MKIPSDFTHMLHMLRVQELQASARASGIMLSVGCNSLEYFEWIDENLGVPDRHIGLEFYLPKPDYLPSSITWIANTAGDMKDVATDSVDIVFAGQTIEHLWYEELAGFFIESARVAKRGGRLMFDSPNREISNGLKWNHPEHTIELTPDEAGQLAQLAGFDVIKTRGHWLCRSGGTLLPLTEIVEDGEWPAERRFAEGYDRPEDSFSWWIEAIRSEREIDIIQIYNFARELSRAHWADRIKKLMQSQLPISGGKVDAPVGFSGALIFGPNAPIPPGEWLIRFQVDAYNAAVSPGHAEVWQDGVGVLVATPLPLQLNGGFVDALLKTDKTLFGLQYRLMSNGTTAFSAAVGVEIFKRGIA